MSSDDDDKNILTFEKRAASPKRTLVHNGRRFSQGICEHKGPYTVDDREWSVSCGDCGALLNPIWVLVKMANLETYYNARNADLMKHLREIKNEIEERSRTKCTHCGNMTAIRFKNNAPNTWGGAYLIDPKY